MTNPGEDADQSASSDPGEGATEVAPTSYEAPPIEQSQGQSDSDSDQATQIVQRPSVPFEPTQQAEVPGYTPPPAYETPSYQPPSYQPPQSYDPPGYQPPQGYDPAPGFSPPGFPPPPDYPGYQPPSANYPPPPPYPGAPGFGPPGPAPGGYPPPPQWGAPPPGFGPPSGYPAPGFGAYGPQQPKTNPFAIASLVTSLVGLCFWFLAPIAGIVLGIVALNQIKQSNEEGRGLAIAGIAIGGVLLFINLLIFLIPT